MGTWARIVSVVMEGTLTVLSFCLSLPSTAFSQMLISFYYAGTSMGSIVTTYPEGCRISPASSLIYSSSMADSLQHVRFPAIEQIENERQRQVTRKLFQHLERGVLLRANREGIFIKRLCQSRVFWSGLGAHYSPGPCKVERDAVVKIFDTSRFFQGRRQLKLW